MTVFTIHHWHKGMYGKTQDKEPPVSTHLKYQKSGHLAGISGRLWKVLDIVIWLKEGNFASQTSGRLVTKEGSTASLKLSANL